MVDPITTRRFLFRCLFLGLCTLIIFVQMLPLSTIPGGIPGPDLLFCLTAVWIMRRPRWAPVTLILFVLLVADILFLKPIGLWPAIAVVGFEYLRSKASGPVEISPPLEIGIAAAVFATLVAVNAIIQLIFGVPQPNLGVLVMHVIVTVMVYPVVIALSTFVFRVRRAKPMDMDGSGIAI